MYGGCLLCPLYPLLVIQSARKAITRLERPKGTKGDKRAISSHVSLFSQTHAWVSRVASHPTALNIGIIIFIQCNHSSRFRTIKNVVALAYNFIIKIRPPHFYCFPTTTTTFLLFFLHHRHHISIVFPPPPPPHF